MPSGEQYYFSDEEDRSRGLIQSKLLTVGGQLLLPLWAKAIDRKTLNAGLLSDKTGCRLHLREIARRALANDGEES